MKKIRYFKVETEEVVWKLEDNKWSFMDCDSTHWYRAQDGPYGYKSFRSIKKMTKKYETKWIEITEQEVKCWKFVWAL